jgi:diguanylate cyclase (GGDEF)-like protein
MAATIDDLLKVSDQETLWTRMGIDAQLRAKRLGKGYRQKDLGESCERFVESIFREICLEAASVHINGKLRISASIDSVSNVVYYDNAVGALSESFFSITGPEIMGDGNLLAVPVSFKGTNYGVALFGSKQFTPDDISVILDCSYDFSQHVENVGEIPILRDLVNTDALTGLYSKRKLGEDYSRMVDSWKTQGQHFGLIFADLDLFKDINTRFGHVAADEILTKVAEIMQSCVRPSDGIYRFGGEEFVFLLPGATPSAVEERAREVSNKLRAERFVVDGREVPELTMSFGHLSTQEENLARYGDNLISIANERLLLAKGFGRDVIVSNIKLDIETGIAGMPSFLPELGNKLAQCNRSFNRGEDYQSIAVLIFDVVHFSELIQQIGNKQAWDVFKDVAKWLFSERSRFDYVARVYNRDNLIVSLSSIVPVNEFYGAARSVAEEYLGKLRQLKIASGGKLLALDYAVGGVVYNPGTLPASELVVKPKVLFRRALVNVEAASKLQERIVIEKYAPPSQQLSLDPFYQWSARP